MTTSRPFKVDKTAFSVVSLAEADDERGFWLSKTPEERLRAVELIRQALYGYTRMPAGIQRVIEVDRFRRCFVSATSVAKRTDGILG